MVEDILLSPRLRTALRKLSRAGSIQARQFWHGSIASVLIAQFIGQIVIEDFGCYAREHYAPLIREQRLIAGV